MSNSITFIAAIRNCSQHLPQIFEQIDSVRPLYQTNCVFVYDNCTDSTSKLLYEYKKKHSKTVEVFELKGNKSPLRTVRIAKARNKALSIFESRFANVSPFFIMFDADDVNTVKKWNLDVLQYYLDGQEDNDWDAMSFNRIPYYDIWALMIAPYKYHCWGFGENSRTIVQYMKSYMAKELEKINENNSIEVLSAFNGFAIYRTKSFIGIRYDGTFSRFINEKFLSEQDIQNTLLTYKKDINIPNLTLQQNHYTYLLPNEHCEHLFFHMNAKRKNNVKIKVSKKIL